MANVIIPGSVTENYIQQISAQNATYDIAVKQGITFYDGKNGTSYLWDGSAPFEVVIPSVTDIIQDPVRMVGTVGANGQLPAGLTPAKGDLLYITVDCDFAGTNPATACEAGDMAIYDGSAWHVIQGENQVTVLPSNTVTLTPGGNAVSLLDVEGTKLTVGVALPEVSLTKNTDNEISVLDGTVAVSGMRVALSKTTGASTDITTGVSIALPTALSNGAVTINESVLQAGDFTFTSGAFPTIAKNAAAITVNTSHSMTIAASGEGNFVTGVTGAISGITFTEDSSAAGADFGFVADLSVSDGASFLNNIHVFDSATDEGNADLTVWGQASVTTNTFVTGLSDGSDVVTGVTVGAVSLNSEGSGILTGIDNAGSDFVSGITFGTVVEDTEASWFVKGLDTSASQVVTDVTVGAVSFISGNTDFAGSAIIAASVSDHVLSFSSGSFMQPVSLSKATDTITKAGFAKSGAKLDGATYTSKGFTSASLVQAESTITKGGLATANMGLTQASTAYKFGKAAGSVVSPIMGYVKHTYSDAVITKNGAVLENKDITATIPADTVAVGLNAGTLPTFTVGTATGTLTGSVDTTLTTSEVSWLAVNPAKKDIAGADEYTLVSASEGGVEVAAAGTYAVDGATVTIDASTYVTDVTLS